jgi:hypothetical protein
VGIEYCHYMLPRPNSFLPSAQQLASFIEQLLEQRWVPRSAVFRGMPKRVFGVPVVDICHEFGKRERPPVPLDAQAIEPLMTQNTRLTWEIVGPREPELRYPMMPVDRVSETLPSNEIYYSVVLEWSANYVYRVSGCVEPFESTHCSCGNELVFAGDEEEKIRGRNLFQVDMIRAICPRCGRSIDVSDWPAVVRDGMTGNEAEVPGGATSRFALVIDCDKAYPSDSAMHLDPDLAALFCTTFGCDGREIGDFSV